MNVFLHRNDLRIHDNRPLRAASKSSETVPVFIDDPRIENKNGVNKRAFRERGLEKLAEKYEERGSGLIIRQGKTKNKLEGSVDEFDAEKVYYSRTYTPTGREIEKEIEALNVESQGIQNNLLVKPQQLSQEYDTFSPFYREWKKVKKVSPAEKPENLADVKSEVPDFDTEARADIPEAGEEAALERWRDFRNKRMSNYKDKRDDVANPEYVSKLSMYYSSGMLGKRRVLSDIENKINREDNSHDIKNYAKYRNEIAWGEFFYQVLYHNPEAVTENYRDIPEKIEWKNKSEELETWKKGETGVPFVDAGMRQLVKKGYMHNRLRQNVASFLTKHLMIDWREGARFFRKHLVDHNTPANNGGWQWSASTGTDSVSIRIFNPVKQGRQYDSHAEYIKRWVPELRGLDPNSIHNWVEMGQKERNEYDTDYPDPIINFNQRYHMGKAMFEKALGYE